MFDLQDEVIGSIASALNAQISSAEIQRSRQIPPSSLGAWELVQRAFAIVMQRSPTVANARESLGHLRAALELDPDYAYAHSALAWMCFSAIINGHTREISRLAQEAEQHLVAALESDTEDPLTLLYIGAAYIYSGRHEKGIRTLERSLERNPHQPDVLMHLGIAHGYLQQFEQAHAYFDRADALAPTGGMSPAYGWYRALVLGFEERYAEAIRLIETHLEHAPRYGSARVELALDLAALGRPDDARREVERAIREDPELNVEGLVRLIGAHPDPLRGAERVERLRDYWPAD
jgi:adenylate cyclase